jgi:hypothetical protein
MGRGAVVTLLTGFTQVKLFLGNFIGIMTTCINLILSRNCKESTAKSTHNPEMETTDNE